MGGLGIQPVEAAHSFMSLLKVTEESTVAVCVHVSMEEVGTKPASLSANRRDGQGAHRMDVSSSLITVERASGKAAGWDRGRARREGDVTLER